MNLTISEIIQIFIASSALGLTIYYRYRDKSNKKLYYIIKNKTIIKNESNLNEISIKYNDKTVNQLTQTELLIFNRKSETIKFKEFGKKIGLKLNFSNKIKIFKREIIDYDNPNVNFDIKVNKNKLNFEFDYFKKGNFVYLKILSNEKNLAFPEIKGEFIENGKLVKFNSFKFKVIEFKRVIPFILIFGLVLSLISQIVKIQDWLLVLLSAFFGYIIIDIIRVIRNSKLEKRIIATFYEES